MCFPQTLEAVEYDEWICQIRSWMESQYKSQHPRDPHDSCQFQYNDWQVSLICCRHISLSEEVYLSQNFPSEAVNCALLPQLWSLERGGWGGGLKRSCAVCLF